MRCPSPNFLLQADALFPTQDAGEWRFVLTDQATGELVAASDFEPDFNQDRLALLALVRGLEAIPRPGRVTLLTSCRSVRDGLKSGLSSWKANGWKWERFGRLVPVRNHDLWRRVDQALQIHSVQCRSWRLCVADHTGCQATETPECSPTSNRVKDESAAAARPAPPSFAPRPDGEGPASFLREPALLVVRKTAKRNRLRIDTTREPALEYARASAG